MRPANGDRASRVGKATSRGSARLGDQLARVGTGPVIAAHHPPQLVPGRIVEDRGRQIGLQRGAQRQLGIEIGLQRLEAVRAFSRLPEAESLAAANKRVGNILKKAEGTVEAKVDAALLKEAAEAALNQALATAAPKANSAFESGDYTASLQALAVLKAPVDDFFDNVMVNAEDPALRANRLGLLATLHQAMNRVADLSRLAA